MQFPANSSHKYCVELVLSGKLCTRLGSKGSLIHKDFPFHEPDGYAMLMSPNKGKTAVHGCHPGDMAVHMLACARLSDSIVETY